MSAPLKLSDEQVQFVRAIVAKRRDAAKVLREYPTNAQLAEQLDCTERYIEKISNGHARVVPRETTVKPNIEELARQILRDAVAEQSTSIESTGDKCDSAS